MQSSFFLNDGAPLQYLHSDVAIYQHEAVSFYDVIVGHGVVGSL